MGRPKKKHAKRMAKALEHIALLEFNLRNATDKVTAFRLHAELEDIADGHWDGPRHDDPPDDWWWQPPEQ